MLRPLYVIIVYANRIANSSTNVETVVPHNL